MKKNKGFTLVELLAVIVILAVIALIATPVILSMIESSRKGSAESSLLSYVDATEKTIVTQSMNAASSVDYDNTYSVMGTTLTEMKTLPGDKACSKTEGGVTSYIAKANGACPSGYSENKDLVRFNIDIKGDQVKSDIVNTLIVKDNNVISGIGTNEILEKKDNKWGITNGNNFTILNSEAQTTLNNIELYNGVNNIYINDNLFATKLEIEY